MKTVLITGNEGFVGGRMETALREGGWDIVGVDIKSGHDCRDFFKTSDKQFDLVIHCAAIVGGRATIEGSPLSVAVDLSIDAEMFGWAIRTQPGRVVYYSSSAAYPIKYQTPNHAVRLYEELIDFDDISNPDLTYGWSKLTGEMLARYAREAGVPVTVLRPFSGYGEEQDLDYPWPSFIKRAKERHDPFTIWGDGKQVRDWVHISDVVGATMACIENDIDGPLNIGNGRATSFNEFAQICCDIAGYEPKINRILTAPKGVEYRVCDPTNMLKVYQPQVTLEESIEKALGAK